MLVSFLKKPLNRRTDSLVMSLFLVHITSRISDSGYDSSPFVPL